MRSYQNSGEVRPRRAWWQGALAGFVATIPMTIFMLLTQRFLPKGQRYDLPPEIITKELMHRGHVKYHLKKGQVVGATVFSHFGYGATMGILYRVFGERIPLPAVARGVLFGLVVWVGSYLGLLPLLGLSESGHTEPAQRNFMMIAAHAIWGSVMAVVADALVDL